MYASYVYNNISFFFKMLTKIDIEIYDGSPSFNFN